MIEIDVLIMFIFRDRLAKMDIRDPQVKLAKEDPEELGDSLDHLDSMDQSYVSLQIKPTNHMFCYKLLPYQTQSGIFAVFNITLYKIMFCLKF